MIGKFLSEIADNGFPIYSFVWEFKLKHFVHGAEQRLLVCLDFVSMQMTYRVKGHYRSAIIYVNFFNAFFFL